MLASVPTAELIDQLTEWGDVTVRHDPHGALAFVQQVRPIALEREDIILEATTLLLAAVARFRLHDLPAALNDITRAETLFQQQSDESGVLRSTLLRATITFMLGDVPAGEAALRKGLSQCREIGNDRYLCVYLGNLAGVLMAQAKYFEALDLLAEERQIEERHGWWDQWIVACHNLSGCYMQLHDPEAAIAVASAGLEREGGGAQQRNVRPHLLHGIGIAHEMLGRVPEALTYCQQAIEHALEISDVRSLANALFDAGRMARSLNDRAQARDLFGGMVTLLAPVPDDTERPVDPYRVLALAKLDDLNEAWSPERVGQLKDFIDRQLPPEREQRRHVYDALVATLEGLGRTADALAALKAAQAFSDQLWRDTIRKQALDSANAQQARDARNEAEQERWRREELGRTLEQVQQLNDENSRLIEQLTEQSEQLEALSLSDALTGIPNRRSFDIQRQIEEQLARKSAQPVAAGLLDIDDFKAINDAYSHAVGDRVLQTIATLLTSNIRAGDTVARYGGEEFAILLPSANTAQARKIGQRIHQVIRDHDWHSIAPGLRVTVSVGLWVSMAGVLAPDAMDRADRLLYDAKRGGKDQVVVSHR